MAANVSESDEDDWEFEMHGDGRSIHGTTPTTEASLVVVDEKGQDSGTGPSQMAGSRSSAEPNLSYPNTEHSGTGFRNMSRDQSPAGQNVLYPNTEQSGTGFSNMPQSQSPAGQNILYQNIDNPGIGQSNMPQSQSSAGTNFPGVHPVAGMQGQNPYPQGYYPMHPYIPGSGDQSTNRGAPGPGFTSPRGSTVQAVPGQDSAGHLATSGFPPNMYSGSSFSTPQVYQYLDKDGIWRFVTDPQHGMYGTPSVPPYGYAFDPRLMANNPHQVPSPAGPSAQGPPYRDVDTAMQKQDEDTSLPRSRDFADSEGSEASIQVIDEDFERMSTPEELRKSSPDTPEEVPKNILLVTKLPKGVSKDAVSLYFENKRRSGGGTVEQVHLQGDRSALVYFAEETVVDQVLAKPSHEIQKSQISVKRYIPEAGSPRESPKDTIEVTVTKGYKELDKEKLELYFENTRSGGGDIKDISIDGNMAYITFDDASVINSVLKKAHTIGAQTLHVSLHEERAEAFADSEKEKYHGVKSGSAENIDESSEEEDDSCFVLQVRNMKDTVSEETLTLFFENRRRTGGGDIEKVEFDAESQTALVYFVEGDVVSRVLQKAPHQLEGKNLDVSAYLPPVTPESQQLKEEKWLRQFQEGTVLEVHGCKDVPEDMLEMYFENERRSGAVMESMKSSYKDGIVYLIYGNSKDAKKVVNKQHTVDKQKLAVKMSASRTSSSSSGSNKSVYQDRFLVTGIKESTSKQALRTYLESKLNCNVKSVLYGEAPGSAVVMISRGPLSLKKMRKICPKQPLEGAFLHVSSVPISNCILVQGLSETTSEDSLLYYFESKRCGNDTEVDVEDCKLLNSPGDAVVYFSDHAVIGKILDKPQKLDKRDITVSLYIECLGVSGGKRDPNWFTLPEPMTFDKLDINKVRFLKESQLYYQEMIKQLKQDHAKIVWRNWTLTVECTLKKGTKNAREIAQKWGKEVMDDVDHFMSRLVSEELQVLKGIWTEVLKNLSGLKMPKEDAARLYVDHNRCSIAVVGHKKVTETLIANVKGIVKDIEDEMERKKQEISETKNMKVIQVKYLMASGFPEDMMTQTKGLQVKADVGQGELTFTGPVHDVKNAQLKMYEAINKVATLKLTNLSDMRLKAIRTDEVEKYIIQKLLAKNLVATWHVEKMELTVLGSSDRDVKEAAETVKTSVEEQHIKLARESVKLLMSPEWREMVSRLGKQDAFCKILPTADNGEVIIVATDNFMSAVTEEVNNFIDENTIYTDSVQYPKGQQRYLVKHRGESIEKMSATLKGYSFHIKYSADSPMFVMQGTKVGLEIAMRKLDDVAATIIHRKHNFTKPGIANVLLSEKGRRHISAIENEEKCIIEKEFDPQEKKVVGTLMDGSDRMDSLGNGNARCSIGGGRTLHVLLGDITNMKVDVIVNAANGDLAHIGGLAGAIVKKGGSSIQRESHEFVQKFGKIKVGGVAETSPGTLPCKMIIHAVGPIWSGGKSFEAEHLREAVLNSLELANVRNMKSIAFPALSTGIYNYPIGQATEVMVQAVKSFFDDCPQSCVVDVHLCGTDPNTTGNFTSALTKVYSQSSVQQQTRSRDQVQTNMAVDSTWRPVSDQQYTPGGQHRHQGARPKHAPAQHGHAATSGSSVGLSIVKGEIAKQKVDVIVNTVSQQLQLNRGAVSLSLLKAGGPVLQSECDKNYPNGINGGDIAITSGGKLKCKHVLHICLPSWGPQVSEKYIQSMIQKCLDRVSQLGHKSVALPALGTGNLQYPRDVVARLMCETAQNYNLDTRIILYPGDAQTIKATQSASGGYDSGSASNFLYEYTMDKMKLTIKQGDIIQEDVTCIVNSTNSRLDLTQGAVAKAILRAGGTELEQECAAKKVKMEAKGIVVTEARGLKCKYIIHVAADRFHGITKVIAECLNKAAGKNAQSVALPALGTGQGFANVKEVSKSLFEAMCDFQQTHPSSSLTDVRMVIFQRDMLIPFKEGVDKALKGGKKTGYFGKFWGYITGSSDPDLVSVQMKILPSTDLHFFSDDQEKILKAIQMLEAKCEDSLLKKEMKEEAFKSLDDADKAKINGLQNKYEVKFDFRPELGKLRIQGLILDVTSAMDEIHKILMNAQKMESDGQRAKVLATVIQWYYTEVEANRVEVPRAYDESSNLKIEDAFKKNDPDVRLPDEDGNVWIIDFAQNIEYQEGNKHDSLKVVRKDMIKARSGELPSQWSTMTLESESVPVQQGTPEYTDVEQKFMSTGRTIVKIERIQTKFLWQQYMAKKEQLDKQNPSKQNELMLWHGTAVDAIPSICKSGFNRSYCGKNATAYGDGVYFAVNPQYSAQDGYSRPDQHGHKHMFYARVLTGLFTQGRQGMRVPPVRDPKNHINYDSVVDRPGGPSMYIIFNDTQAYPEYLVTFQ